MYPSYCPAFVSRFCVTDISHSVNHLTQTQGKRPRLEGERLYWNYPGRMLLNYYSAVSKHTRRLLKHSLFFFFLRVWSTSIKRLTRCVFYIYSDSGQDTIYHTKPRWHNHWYRNRESNNLLLNPSHSNISSNQIRLKHILYILFCTPTILYCTIIFNHKCILQFSKPSRARFLSHSADWWKVLACISVIRYENLAQLSIKYLRMF